MKPYKLEDIRRELYLLRKFIDNEPYEYTGYKTNLRKVGVLVDRIVGRITEVIETGGIAADLNLSVYDITQREEAKKS